MALLDPESYSSDVLVVGDGNFSFSVCLATSLSKKRVKIVATSLDSFAAVKDNPFAVQNIKTLSSFEKVEILHEVDATDLSKTFGSKTFRRVIFNFPHTGGKSKISKSRKLLQEFFASAAKHVQPFTGEICVSLCQGQGGTPVDIPKRELGNTWQVVYQACKADLILNAVHPFRSSDYVHYRSAGFRGQLGKSFHTVNGLTHVFIHGIPLETIPDLKSFKTNQNTKTRKLHLNCIVHDTDDPVSILSKKLKHFFSSAEFANKCIGPFTDCSQFDDVGSEGPSYVGALMRGQDVFQAYSRRVLQWLKTGESSFLMNGIDVDFTLPPSSKSQPISHKMVIAKTFTETAAEDKIKAEKNFVVEAFINEFCSNFEVSRTECSGELRHQGNLQTNFKVVNSETFELINGKQVKFYNVTNATSADIKCNCKEKASTGQRQCIYCRVEHQYLGHNSGCSSHDSITSLIDPLTKTDLHNQEMLLLSGGLFCTASIASDRGKDMLPGWLVEINLDYLAMAVYNIPDIRLLSSNHPRFKEQFTATDKGSDVQDLGSFVPFSLFPPTYTHDISFWITAKMTEQKFFQDMYEATQGCICDVQFLERYHDAEQDKVSYNYRMVYSSCDQPLTHLQTVKMQNLLRRKLLDCSFDLK